MRTLQQALQDHELIVLRVIGEWWELDLTGSDKDGSIEELDMTLQRLDLKTEKAHSPPEEAAALDALIEHGGRMTVAAFSRRFGEVRMMGPGKLEREEPWFDPENAAEALWYRGLLYKGFDNTADGMMEFYYLPDELFEQFADDAPKTTAAKKSAPIDLAINDEDPDENEDEYEEDDLEDTFEEDDETDEFEEYEYADLYEEEDVTIFDEDGFATSTSEAPQPETPATQNPNQDIIDEPTFGKEIDVNQLRYARSRAPMPSQPATESESAPAAGSTQSNRTDEKNPAVSQPATPAPPTDAVDDLTSILIMAQRIGLDSSTSQILDSYLIDKNPHRRSLLINLASEMEMVRPTENGLRTTRMAVDWLQASREQQLRAIADAWSSSLWNELRHTPEIQCEGEWENDPITARNGVLDALPRHTEWLRVQQFIQFIKDNTPDFQRPDGDYDTWYVRDLNTNQYLSGFESWESVEGRLITFLLRGPLTWLGLAVVNDTATGLSFRVTDRFLAWMQETEPPKDPQRVPLIVGANGMLTVSRDADRYHRFQTARVSDPLPVTSPHEFLYRITPKALSEAKKQGISPDRVLQFLEKASSKPLPAGVKRAIDRWGERGVEGKLETVVVLRVRDAAIMQTLRENPRTRDLIGESLGTLAAAVQPANQEKLRSAIAQLGLLLDVNM